MSEERTDRDEVEDNWRVRELRHALNQVDDLLRQLDEWDVMRVEDGSDGPYWRRLIAEVREVNRIALRLPEEPHGD